MREFIIDKDFDGQRLDKFMFKQMSALKTSEVYMALRKKKVRVNGKHKDGAYRIQNGDIVCIYMNDECFEGILKTYPWQSANSSVSVIYEDENLIVADKPSGMPSQDTEGDKDSLESRLRSYLFKKGEIKSAFIPSLCHRIDRNTSGLVIMAKNAQALRILNQKIKDKEVRKLYLCETEKVPSPPSGKICGWLVRDKRARKMIFSKDKPSNTSDAVWCETLYKTIRKDFPVTIEAELLTGRTHQIRASLAFIGCPLSGDVKYGAKPNKSHEYQSLISYKIIFDFKTPSGELEYLKGKTIALGTGDKYEKR